MRAWAELVAAHPVLCGLITFAAVAGILVAIRSVRR